MAIREEIVVATKVFSPIADGPNRRGLSRKHIFDACDASLKRLNMDYIDLYQIHRFDDNTPIETTRTTTPLPIQSSYRQCNSPGGQKDKG